LPEIQAKAVEAFKPLSYGCLNVCLEDNV
jgi:hypothetical protein